MLCLFSSVEFFKSSLMQYSRTWWYRFSADMLSNLIISFAMVGGSAIEFEMVTTVLSADSGDDMSGVIARLDRYSGVGALACSFLNSWLGFIVMTIGFLLVPTSASVVDSPSKSPSIVGVRFLPDAIVRSDSGKIVEANANVSSVDSLSFVMS